MTELRRRLARFACACALVTVFAVPVLVSTPAGALTFNVTNTDDSGPGSLRQALMDAETDGGANTIEVQAGLGTVVANSELAWCASTTTINGNGITIDMNGSPRGLVAECGGLVASQFAVTGVGGSIADEAAPVMTQGNGITLTDCTITGNVVTVTSDDDVAGGVNSDGGGITLTSCTIADNVATTQGGDSAGGVYSGGGGVTVFSSDISGNSATSAGNGDSGGGIGSGGGGISVFESTVSFNAATTTAESGDDAGGGVHSDGGGVTFRNTAVDCNVATANEDAGGAVNSEGGGVTLNGGEVIGNSASSTGGGLAENEFFTGAGTLTVGDDVIVSDDTTGCTAPPGPEPEPPAPEPLVVAPRFTG